MATKEANPGVAPRKRNTIPQPKVRTADILLAHETKPPVNNNIIPPLNVSPVSERLKISMAPLPSAPLTFHLPRATTASSEMKVPPPSPAMYSSQSNVSPSPGLNGTKKNWKNFGIRALWAILMMASFVALILAGQIYAVSLVIFLQTMLFKEVITLAHVPSQQNRLPWFRTLAWYFLFSTNYFLYGESLIFYFKKSFMVDAFLLPLATHHRFISFCLYLLGLILFVLNLKKGFYKFQFGQFAWTHMALLLVVCQSHFVINNTFEGLIWFLFPASLVICNDTMAYITGFFVGRTPLIRLSPRKTWEGYIGGFVFTLLFAFFFARILSQSQYLICPIQDWTVSFFSFDPSMCTINPVFLLAEYKLPPFLSAFLKHIVGRPVYTVSVAPIQFHALILAAFASILAPFGGFFASGLKRAFKIKDFSDSIPGHGGITDRMDCQLLMGLFAYIYVSSFIKMHQSTVDHILQLAVTGLRPEQQLELYQSLHEYLISHQLLSEA